MDVVTQALVAALTALASGIGQKVIDEGYNALKALIKKKHGEKSDVSQALEALEAKPKSTGRQATLQEELEAIHADQDEELVTAARQLLADIKQVPQGAQMVQQITGNYNAVVQGGGSATVHVNQHPKDQQA
ncbi:hypothetical protein EI42_04732 [Thermosporothrix hazakensis]|jgi:hypothetical protein|uniref:Uncharacterized protein n=2 Tax=Thermosporothrix TaxID=768650 RepID=A0A326U9V6_THEHA|nr:hypothetical protein [Thermosporothrix hazakensis]PZW24041.1 hypothetical protein EI42_04732 [Thermosporothrix hazakensis]BBH87827.1 hypothetical protein KTC_25780 [Thermosporothrix sp. COM3]GCE50255.1 hypothetical protein KTH_51240 [Thermosporothrix hazakensis]